jgi:urease accessory protein UreH
VLDRAQVAHPAPERQRQPFLPAQRARLQLAGGARLEWLPLETIAYSACQAENQVRLAIEPGAEAMGWDVLGMGVILSFRFIGRPSFESG